MKYCPYCGIAMLDDMLYCPNCGQKFQSTFSSESENRAHFSPMLQTCSSTDRSASGSNVLSAQAHKTKSKSISAVILILFIIVILVTIIVLCTNRLSQDNVSQLSEDKGNQTVLDNTTIQNQQNADIASEAASVLYLEVYDDAGTITATASGFLINDGTQLITNYHVISTAYSVRVFSANGKKLANLHSCLYYDIQADLAVLQCSKPITSVRSLPIGNSDLVRQGDTIYAVSYPLGVANTLSNGVISSRYLDEYDVDTLQITAAISPGSSGGALLNEQGEVIGIVCASYTSGQNLNTAIASNVLTQLLLEEQETISLPALCSENTRYGASAFNLLAGNFVCETMDAYYYSNWKNANAIYCVAKKDSQSKKIGHGGNINAYSGSLYYTSGNSIYRANLDGSHEVDLGISLSELSDKYHWAEEYICSMLIAENKIFLAVLTDHQACSLCIFDLNSLNFIDCIQNTTFNLTYQGNTLYTGLETGEILALDMNTLTRKYIQTSYCGPYILGIDRYCNIYFNNGSFSEGVSRLSPNGTITTDSATIGEQDGYGIGHVFIACGDDLYFQKSGDHFSETKKYSHITGQWSQWTTSDFDLLGVNFVENLHYFYQSNGNTYSAIDGSFLGSWIFQ